MNNLKMQRHGDFLLIKTSSPIPQDATKEQRDNRGRLVIGEGEVTGHAHAVHEKEADIYTLNGNRWLVVGDSPSTVTHEEHNTLTLDPNTVWIVVQQQQYDIQSGMVQKVRD